MKKTKTVWILALVFAAVLASAYVLYQKLGAEIKTDTLMASEEKNLSQEGGDSVPVPETSGAEQQEEQEEQKQAEDSGETASTKAPDFSVVDGEGQEVKLSDFLGKPVILNFWASWCGPCKSEMPDFQEIYEEYGEDIQFMMVNMTDGARETVETAKTFVKEAGYTFPVFYDTGYEGVMTYGVTAVPTTYFIDGEGNAVAWAMSALDKETVLKGIEMIQ